MGKRNPDGFEVYEGEDGFANGRRTGWYWRLRRKGRIVADGSEGYSRRADCLRAVRRVRSWAGQAPVRVK